MITELLLSVGTSILMTMIINRRRKPPPSTEPLCTGYHAHIITQGKRSYVDHRLDCKSLRDPCCGDGRCSFHCRQMCKCSASNEPEAIGRKR